MDGKLTRSIEENLGVKQGRNKSSDHYKVYIAPLLDTLDTSSLGVWIGHINVGVSGVADDVYLTLLHMGGVFKTQVAFDAILDPLGVKIEHRYYLTIPIYTFRSV